MAKVLVLAANPDDSPRLRVDREIRRIQAKARAAKYPRALQLVPCLAAQAEDLTEALMREQPHVVHFTGHARAEGLLMEREDGSTHVVAGSAVAALLRALTDNIRVVFLNACETYGLACEVATFIDCAVGTKDAIDDEAAAVFAASFYLAIASGRSVRTAYDVGRATLELHALQGSHAIGLACRPGVDPARVVLIDAPLDPLPARKVVLLARLNFLSAKRVVPRLVSLYSAEAVVEHLAAHLDGARNPMRRAALCYALGLAGGTQAQRLLERTRANHAEAPNVVREAELALARIASS